MTWKERESRSLRHQVAEMAQEQSAQQAEFDQYRRDQVQKLKKERKLWEEHRNSTRAGQSKEDRDRIEVLEGEVEALQLQLSTQKRKVRDTAWCSLVPVYLQLPVFDVLCLLCVVRVISLDTGVSHEGPGDRK